MIIGRLHLPHPGFVVIGLLALLGMAWVAAQIDAHDAGVSKGWLIFGFGAQFLFMARFLVQWLASERAKRTVVPVSFWWFSLLGGISLGIYFMRRGDPVAIMGQLFPTLIYLRNLWLIYAEKHQSHDLHDETGSRLASQRVPASHHG